jgi:hypothetical protein
MVAPKKKDRRLRDPDKVAQLAVRAREAQERTRAAKEQAKLAKRQAHEARKLFKQAKKVAKRAKNELHALSQKLKRLLGAAASRSAAKGTDEVKREAQRTVVRRAKGTATKKRAVSKKAGVGFSREGRKVRQGRRINRIDV